MTAELGPWPLLLFAVGATYVWRGLGVLFAARIDSQGPLFQWVTCVSYAMLAGLVARMIVLPLGGLAEAPLVDRLAGTAVGFAVFFLCRRNVLAGVGAGVAAFVLLQGLRGG